MKPGMILLTGWGYPADALRTLQDELSHSFQIHLLDPLDLLRPLESGNPTALSREGYSKINRLLQDAGPTYITGWSLGGILALRIALDHARFVSGLCLISSTLKFCRDETWPLGVDPQGVRSIQARLKKDPVRTIKAFQRLSARPLPPAFAASNERIAALAEQRQDSLAAGLDFLLREDLRPHSFVSCPNTVVLHGSEDAIIPPRAGRALADATGDGEFCELPGIGHDLPIQAPKVVGEAITQMIDRQRATRGGGS